METNSQPSYGLLTEIHVLISLFMIPCMYTTLFPHVHKFKDLGRTQYKIYVVRGYPNLTVLSTYLQLIKTTVDEQT